MRGIHPDAQDIHASQTIRLLGEDVARSSTMSWYAVRCVFQTPHGEGFSYEERVTLWQADDFGGAIALAEAEARAYEFGEYTELAQAYLLFDEPGHGAEVYSLIRDSDLPSHVYLDRFFDTGAERLGSVR